MPSELQAKTFQENLGTKNIIAGLKTGVIRVEKIKIEIPNS